MYVFLFQLHWHQGHRIDNSIESQIFSTREKAQAYLNEEIKACMKRLSHYYTNDEITCTCLSENAAFIRAKDDEINFSDSCALAIIEQKVL